jgi:integrase
LVHTVSTHNSTHKSYCTVAFIPTAVRNWLCAARVSLNESNGLAWTTIAKMRGIMHRIYKIGILHELVTKNPVQHVETRSKSSYRAIIITPAHTLAILKSLASPLHFALVLTCAATALRSSEILALRWSDVLWGEGRIRISKRWAKGEDGYVRCIRFLPGIFAHGSNNRPTRRSRTLCFRR